jgi:hypothetical protein
VSPLLASVAEAGQRLFSVACDPQGMGYRDTDSESARADDGQVLRDVVPDLRAEHAALSFTGAHFTAGKGSTPNPPLGTLGSTSPSWAGLTVGR